MLFTKTSFYNEKEKKKNHTYLLSSSLSGNFLDFQVCLCCRFIKLSLEAGSPVNDWVQGHTASSYRRKGLGYRVNVGWERDWEQSKQGEVWGCQVEIALRELVNSSVLNLCTC